MCNGKKIKISPSQLLHVLLQVIILKLPTLTVDFNCFYDLCLCCRTAKGSPPVTFAVAACETQNVSVSVLPCFGLGEGSGVTAKEMWEKMVKVLFSLLF